MHFESKDQGIAQLESTDARQTVDLDSAKKLAHDSPSGNTNSVPLPSIDDNTADVSMDVSTTEATGTPLADTDSGPATGPGGTTPATDERAQTDIRQSLAQSSSLLSAPQLSAQPAAVPNSERNDEVPVSVDNASSLEQHTAAPRDTLEGGLAVGAEVEAQRGGTSEPIEADAKNEVLPHDVGQ